MFGKKYQIKALCYNCGAKFILKIPRGVVIEDYIESGEALCSNCGCDTLGTPNFGEPEKPKKTINLPVKRKLEAREDDEW